MAEGSSSATDAYSRSTPSADARRLVIVRVGGGAGPYQPDTQDIIIDIARKKQNWRSTWL